jgi:uncharacterized membrane protein
MKDFFRQSYWFWVISKVIFVVMLFISVLSILGAGQLGAEETAINLLALVEALLLTVTLFGDFSATAKFGILKIITGVLLIVFGIGLLVVLLTVGKGSQSSVYMLGFPFAAWMVLMGLFDVFRVKKNIGN